MAEHIQEAEPAASTQGKPAQPESTEPKVEEQKEGSHIDRLYQVLIDGFSALKTEIGGLRTDITGGFVALKTEIGGLKTEIGGLKTEITGGFVALKAEIGSLKKDITEGFAVLSTGISDLSAKIDQQELIFKSSMDDQLSAGSDSVILAAQVLRPRPTSQVKLPGSSPAKADSSEQALEQSPELQGSSPDPVVPRKLEPEQPSELQSSSSDPVVPSEREQSPELQSSSSDPVVPSELEFEQSLLAALQGSSSDQVVSSELEQGLYQSPKNELLSSSAGLRLLQESAEFRGIGVLPSRQSGSFEDAKAEEPGGESFGGLKSGNHRILSLESPSHLDSSEEGKVAIAQSSFDI